MKIKLFLSLLFYLVSAISAETIQEVVQKTNDRIQKESYSYTAVVTMKGMNFFVDRTFDKSGELLIFNVAPQGKPVEILRLRIKDGFWYLKEQGEKQYSKYRAWEAFPKFPNFYAFWTYSELSFDAEKNYEIDPNKDTMTYFTPLDEEAKKMTKAYLKQVERFMSNPKVAQQAKIMKEFLEKGYRRTVDQKTGLVVEQSNVKVNISIKNFKWLGTDFSIDETPGELEKDYSATPNFKESILIRHAPMWNPKVGRKIEGTSSYVNKTTLEKRRVPFQGAACMPASFSPDKKIVYCSGMIEVGAMSVFSVNLETGENISLNKPEVGKNSLFPKVSPDGKSLVYLEVSPEGGMLTNQIMLINLGTKEVKKLVANIPTTGGLSWRSDSKGFYVQKGIDAGGICYISTEGEVTEIIQGGERPIVIGENELLFEKEDKYFIADKVGKNIKPSKVDFSEYFYLNSNSVGDFIVMMKKDMVNGPRPCIWEKGSEAPKVFITLPGLWSFPAL